MAKFKAGDYVMPARRGAEYIYIYRIDGIRNSKQSRLIKVYKITTSYNTTREETITYIEDHFRLVTDAERLLYVKF